jgi:hypothetical protein
VPSQFGNSLSVFSSDANGDAMPIAEVTGGATGLSGPQAVAVLPPHSTTTPQAQPRPAVTMAPDVLRTTSPRPRHPRRLLLAPPR